MGIEGYFDDLRDSGTLDSIGVFTVDPSKVSGKMARYQLAASHDYCLFLVQVAVLEGVESLDVDCQAGRADYFFPGLCYSKEELQELLVNEHSERPGSKALRIALTAAGRLGEVRLICRHETLEVGLVSEGTNLSFFEQPSQSSATSGLRFRVSGAGVQDPTSLLKKRCRWARLDWSGMVQRRRVEIYPEDLPAFVVAVLYHPSYRLVHNPRVQASATFLPERYPGLIYLAWMPDLGGSESKVMGLKDGVLYPLRLRDIPPKVVCVLDCSELKLDLSFSGFVEDELFKQKLALIKRAFQGALARGLEQGFEPDAFLLGALQGYVHNDWESEDDDFNLDSVYHHFRTLSPPTNEAEMRDFLLKLEPDLARHEVSLCLQAYRRRASRSRQFNPKECDKWLSLENTFRQLTGRPTQELQIYQQLSELLSGQDVKPEVTRPFLAELTRVFRSPESKFDIEALRSDLGIHPSWLEPVYLVELLTTGEDHFSKSIDASSFPLSFARLLAQGRFERALLRLQTHRNEDEDGWLAVVRDGFSGSLPFSLVIRLRVQSLGRTLTKGEGSAASRYRAGFVQGHSKFGRDLSTRHIFSHGFWVLAIRFTAATSTQKWGLIRKVWAAILLQAALGRPGESSSIEDTLKNPLVLPLLEQ